MGFVREKKVFEISWAEGHELHGLKIQARSVSFDEYFRVQRLIRSFYEPPGDWDDERYEKNANELLEAFAAVLLSWDLEERLDQEGPSVAVPATLEGLRSQDIDFVVHVVVQWHQVLAGVHDDEGGDLGKDSTSGDRFPEASLPMEPPSPSP